MTQAWVLITAKDGYHGCPNHLVPLETNTGAPTMTFATFFLSHYFNGIVQQRYVSVIISILQMRKQTHREQMSLGDMSRYVAARIQSQGF